MARLLLEVARAAWEGRRPLSAARRGFYLFVEPWPEVDDHMVLVDRVAAGEVLTARDYLLFTLQIGGVN